MRRESTQAFDLLSFLDGFSQLLQFLQRFVLLNSQYVLEVGGLVEIQLKIKKKKASLSFWHRFVLYSNFPLLCMINA